MKKVVITDYQYDNIDTERKIITGAGFELYDYQVKSPEKVIPAVKDADAIITQYAHITDEVIDSLQHCKVIIRYGIGVNNVDIERAAQKGIYVCNVPDFCLEEVSDHTISMMLSLSRKLPILTAAFRRGDSGYGRAVPVFRFCESTVGLIGFGHIPQIVARKLAGFGVKIKAFDPYGNKSVADELGVKLVEFDEILNTSDFISVHCPLNSSTQNMITSREFKQMKHTAFIVNTARGGIINEQDLIEALRRKEIAGCGIDVFENEPVAPDHPLLNMENVIATPHCAWYSETAINKLQHSVADEAVHVLNGNRPFHCVNIGLV